MTKTFELGEKVLVTGIMTKTHDYDKPKLLTLWHKQEVPPQQGVIVGTRTVYSGSRKLGGFPDENEDFTRGKSHKVWLVATDLRKKHITCDETQLDSLTNSDIEFEKISMTFKQNGKCEVCKKITTRQKTFEQTVNPFNLNAQGVPRSRREVMELLLEQAQSWVPNFTHANCEWILRQQRTPQQF